LQIDETKAASDTLGMQKAAQCHTVSWRCFMSIIGAG
jgi:hypothetical protein